MEIRLRLHPDGKIEKEVKDLSNLDELLRVLFSVIKIEIDSFNSFVDKQSFEPKTVEAIKEEVFDLVNYSASHILQQCFPEMELRPGLTEEAILKMENDLIDAKYEEHIKGAGTNG